MEMIDTNYDMNFEPIHDVMTPMNENEKSFISLPSSQFQRSELATPSNHQTDHFNFCNLESTPSKSPEKIENSKKQNADDSMIFEES